MRITFWLVLLSFQALGQPSLFDALHQRTDTVVIELTTNWKEIVRSKMQEAYTDVSLTVGEVNYAGRLRTRGNARLRVCNFPSLKVKLSKEALDSAGYSSLNDLKFVLQCSKGKTGTRYLYREMLLYDLHALVSPYHHRTIPVRVVVGQRDTLQGFLIESEEQLQARYGGTVLEDTLISTRLLNRKSYANLCLFNYMILNTDWNIYNLHNVECLKTEAVTGLVPIPYDFDYSGLVATHYSVPREELGMASVQEPRFLGRHLSAKELEVAAAEFLYHEAALLQRIDAEPTLDERDKKRLTERLHSFFRELRDEKRLLQLVSN